MRCISIIYILILLFACCNNQDGNSQNKNSSNTYARGFHIEKKERITKLTVYNPWEKAKNIAVEYFLVDRDMVVPDSIAGKRIIKTPVERVICLSTTHLAFLEVLNETDAVAGISGSQYVFSQQIRKRIDHGEVPDVGYGQNLNYELIISQQPDLVMIYGIGSEVTGSIQKLEELGIPMVMVAEYLEETPLGKAEWIKFVGTLFQKEEEADDYFRSVEEEYHRLKMLVAARNTKPRVMVGSPYKETWWVPGGNSYMANLIADAGGNYIGKSNSSHESYVVSFENALAWGSQADIWINMGNMASKKEIITTDMRFENFNVFSKGKIFNNNKRFDRHGGNDFWESGTVNPHLILHDLIAIFHPGVVDRNMFYYQEIE